MQFLRSRRVVREWSDYPVPAVVAREVVRAALWAPAAGNRRVQRYAVVLDRTIIELIRAVSPGISGHPRAIVVVSVDHERARQVASRKEALVYLDVGTATQNMLLAAHAFGLGAGPVTSFSAAAVCLILSLPHAWEPAVLICLGYPAKDRHVRRVRAPFPARLDELLTWVRSDAQAAGDRIAQTGGGGA